MPGAALIKRVHGRYRTPVASILITSALAILISLYAAAYTVITSISTIALYLAYALPVALNLRNRRRGRGEFTTPSTAPWSLGRWSAPVNVIALAWVAVLTIVFSLPPNELTLWTMLGLAALLALYWLSSARGSFRGPTPADEAELRRLEATVEAPGSNS